MLDYRIDTFLTLCESMNYRKTAEMLHISQPAVTQQIHYLENQYGQKLFQYENRRLVKIEAAAILEHMPGRRNCSSRICWKSWKAAPSTPCASGRPKPSATTT